MRAKSQAEKPTTLEVRMYQGRTVFWLLRRKMHTARLLEDYAAWLPRALLVLLQ